MTPKHFFFDLDGTLTRSRTLMAEDHQKLFAMLCDKKDVAVITGGQLSQIKKQIPPHFDGKYFVLSQSGNYAISKSGEVLWAEQFSSEQKTAILSFVRAIHDEVALLVKDENDLVEDRGSQVSYSLLGHHEDVSKKEAFDPGAKKRLEILARHKEDVAHLRGIGVDVRPGGTTTFDFTIAGKHKGFNVTRLIEKEGWRKEDCVYVGDALFHGGNDETVIDIIPIHAVKNPDEAFDFIQGNLV